MKRTINSLKEGWELSTLIAAGLLNLSTMAIFAIMLILAINAAPVWVVAISIAICVAAIIATIWIDRGFYIQINEE